MVNAKVIRLVYAISELNYEMQLTLLIKGIELLMLNSKGFFITMHLKRLITII